MIRPRLIILALLSVLLLSATGAYAQAPTPQGTALGSGFTYQGQLKKGGQLYNGACDFQFGLYDAVNAGSQIGTLLNQNGVKVIDGVFAAKLDFGANAFTGSARWLQIAVKCPGDATFVSFSTRQELTPTPYAIGLVPGAVVHALNGDGFAAITNVDGKSGVIGINEAGGSGVFGSSQRGSGVFGVSKKWVGVTGSSDEAHGIWGESQKGAGIIGVSKTWIGIFGRSDGANSGVHGESVAGDGVHGVSTRGDGVVGIAKADNKSGIFGSNEAGGARIFGLSARCDGAVGIAKVDNKSGVFGSNEAGGTGVFGRGERGDGVVGEARMDNKSGVFGSNLAGGSGVFGNSVRGSGVFGRSENGTGVYGFSVNGYAGDFNGKVRVSSLEIAGGADLAEPFDVSSANNAAIIPGTVVCIDPANPGKLVVCANAYDRTVAGVISGAGGVQPGMVMRQEGSAADGQHPVALTGRVYVWVDATQQPIHPGDLLTTSATPGHAVKAADHEAAQGAVIGKAMGTLESGKGLVLVLVALN
jgi:hypothetical protein